MRTLFRNVLGGVVLALAIVPAAQATVLRVLAVKTDNLPGYLQEIHKGQGLMKNAGLDYKVRIWSARFAGPEAGSVVVAIEYPDLSAFAAAYKTMSTDPALRAWTAGLDKIRTIVSDSLYEEQTP